MTNAAAIAQARQLHTAGDKKGAFAALAKQLYGVGYADDLRDALERLFPVTPDVERKLADLDQQLRSGDAKVRKTAARQTPGVKDYASADGLNYLYYPQARWLLIDHLASDDSAVVELMAFALANCFRGFVLDQRAYRPLLPLLSSKQPLTRAWASEALALLGDQAAADVLPLTNDKEEQVWQAAFSALHFGLAGGGTLERKAWGPTARRVIAQAMLQADHDREIAYREWVAALLALSAATKDLPALQAWQKKDGSKSVKRILQGGIDRLQSPPPRKPAPSKAKTTSTKKKGTAKQPPAAPAPVAPPPDPAFLPCQFFPGEGGSAASLMFTDFAPTADIFAEYDYDGGGYGWHGVVDALVRKRAPHLKKKIAYDPEASMFVAASRDESALREVAALIRAAHEDEKILRQALKNANPKLMD